MTQRADHATLEALGFTPEELSDMGLDRPATGDPASLCDAYLRRSAKREDLSTLRGHLRDIVRWCRAEGLQIRHVWFEQLSASKTYIRRMEFEKATKAVLDGLSKTMAVWKTDRFDRRGMGAVGRVLDEFDTRRARLVSVSEGLDSSKGGRIVFAILSERAREEAKDIGKRVKMGHDSHKGDGRRGTGRPPFGLFSPPGSGLVEPHPDEYPTARRLADLLLARKTTKVTAHTLNEEGHRTRSGKHWTPTAVSKLAQSPLFAGMVPNRERVTDEHGNPLDRWKGYGEPLTDGKGNTLRCGTGVVTPAEWHRIRGYIAGRVDPVWAKGKPEAKYIGTGFLKCPHCKGPSSHRGGRYRCEWSNTKGKDFCKGFATLAERVDFALGEMWIRHITSLEPGDPVLMEIGRRWLAFSDPQSEAEQVNTLEAVENAQKRLKKLEDDYYVYGKVSEERYEELSTGLSATISTMSAKLEEMTSADLSPLMDADTLREAWRVAEVADRRMLLKCALKSVTVKPAARRGDHTPIEERLDPDWVTAA